MNNCYDTLLKFTKGNKPLFQFAQITGVIERIAESGSAHKYQYSSGGIEQKQIISLAINNHQQGLQAVFTLLSELNFIQDISDLLCIGHRVVHGGETVRLVWQHKSVMCHESHSAAHLALYTML
jgi:acetate kinase